MALRDTSAFDQWVVREQPSAAAQLVAAAFIESIGEAPWRSPSTPLGDLSDQPYSQRRRAVIDVDGEDSPVEIWYRHYYDGDDVDLIDVTNR